MTDTRQEANRMNDYRDSEAKTANARPSRALSLKWIKKIETA